MSSDIQAAHVASKPTLPQRFLGQTGHAVTLFGLGGEGVLRTYNRTAEAVRVIHQALNHGVNYCDTAPAYAGSMDYYGAALGERRSEIFLASTRQMARGGTENLSRHQRQPRPGARPGGTRPLHGPP
jgi:aryl-alcohol dehydrogenase-like predicted oxidoreductase